MNRDIMLPKHISQWAFPSFRGPDNPDLPWGCRAFIGAGPCSRADWPPVTPNLAGAEAGVQAVRPADGVAVLQRHPHGDRVGDALRRQLRMRRVATEVAQQCVLLFQRLRGGQHSLRGRSGREPALGSLLLGRGAWGGCAGDGDPPGPATSLITRNSELEKERLRLAI